MKPTFFAVIVILILTMIIGGCATLTSEANQQINFKAPGCKGKGVVCTATNKRGLWRFEVPGVEAIRRSDDVLQIDWEDAEGNSYKEAVAGRAGGKIVASAVFLDFGIVDSITDKHREYPEQILIDMCM